MADERSAADEQPAGDDNAGTGPVGGNPDGAGPEPATEPLVDPDATAPMALRPRSAPGGVDGTRPLPPVEDSPRWSARAGVRPRPAPAEEWSGESVVEDPYGGRSWFTPVIVAVVVLILLAVLGAGLYLIYRNAGRGGGPAPTPSAPATSAVSSAPPSSAGPSPTQSPSPPVPQVPVPPVVGRTQQEAQLLLDAAGLTYRVDTVVDGSVKPGTVISVTPAAGTMVAKGSQVTLVVAAAPPPSPSASPSPSPSGATG